jgi:hypothetical protein
MTINLPEIITRYVDASNEHNVKSIVACFSDEAFVRDEREEHRGKRNIEAWIVKRIEKYKFQFKPLVVAMEVSGTFDGSPATLDYHFTVENEKISSLTIE